MKKISFFILFLSIPLMSSGLYMLGMGIFLFFLCLFLSYDKIISTKLYLGDLCIFLAFFIYGLSTLTIKSSDIEHLYVNAYFVTFIYIFITYTFVSLLKDFNYKYIIKIFKIYLTILIITIFAQWFIYFLLGEYFDINKIVSFGESESRYTSKSFKSLGLIRPTSFFTEPSNASAAISMLTFCYMFLIKKIDSYIILGFITSILTLSTAGVLIGSSSLAIIFFFCKTKSKKYFLKLFTIIFCIIIISYMISFSFDRINNSSEYDMLSTRSIITDVIKNQEWYNHIIGNGINILSQPININGYTIHDYSFRDSGFFINLYYSFGIAGFILFIIWSRIKIRDSAFLMIFYIILQSKFDYLQPTFWLLIFTISILHNKNKLKAQ